MKNRNPKWRKEENKWIILKNFGIIIAILILITKLHDLILAIVLIFLGAFVGNYIQQNKEFVKEKLKKFIDKM